MSQSVGSWALLAIPCITVGFLLGRWMTPSRERFIQIGQSIIPRSRITTVNMTVMSTGRANVKLYQDGMTIEYNFDTEAACLAFLADIKANE